MKKSLKVGITVTALAAAMTISGILAYFTDADTATNTFTVGKVSLDLQETDWEPQTDILPSQTIKKNPTVVNDGNNEEFVFVEVSVPYENIATANADGSKNAAADTELFSYTVNSGWVEIDSTKDTTGKVVKHRYVYGTADECTALAVDAETPAVFDEVTFVNAIEDQSLEEATFEILINAYGIQTTDINGGKTKPAEVWTVIANQVPDTDKTNEVPYTDVRTDVL